jgi:PEP-CTERM motif
MKMIRFFLLVAMFIPFATFAHAGIHATIADPPFTSGPFTGWNLGPNDLSIPVVFGQCSTFEDGQLKDATDEAGCFEIVNESGKSITSITLSFMADPTTFGTPQCDLGGVFADVSCTESGGDYVLSFSGGSIDDGNIAIIGESLPSTDFKGVPVGAAITYAPEPGSLVLLGTGVITAAGSVFRRRRAALSAPRL